MGEVKPSPETGPSSRAVSVPTPLFAAFIDPGRAGGVAVVRCLSGDVPPVAVFGAGIWGDGERWDASAASAFRGAAEAIGDSPSITWIEIPGDQASWAVRTGKALRRRGQQDIRALSMRAGALSVRWEMATGRKPEEHQQRDWAQVWSPAIPSGKRGDGMHRVREAGALIEGAGEILEGINKTCRVDVAEAFLGAAAALISARTKRRERT